MKRIVYIAPIDWMAGNLSGTEELQYQGKAAYSINVGESVTADAYNPKLIAKYRRRDGLRYFQIRTRTSVHMTAANKLSLSAMGGAGALFAAILRDKSSEIYHSCLAACPRNVTLRAFVIDKLRKGLINKVDLINISQGVNIVNPWVSSAAPNVPISDAVLNKFAPILLNS